MNLLQMWNRLDRNSDESQWCLLANRWGARRRVGQAFGLISRLGDGVFWYALIAAMAVTGGSRGVQAALHMSITGIAAWGLYRWLKQHTRRPRPFRAHPGIVAHVPPLDEYSFPSGHTLHAVSFSLVALAWFPALWLLLVPLCVLIGLSRVVLGLHFPSDVLAATVLGFAVAGVSLWLVPGVGWFG